MSSLDKATVPPFLSLTDAECTQLANAVFKICLDYWRTLPQGAVWTPPDSPALEQYVRGGIAEKPLGWSTVLEGMQKFILSSQAHLAHPRFFAFVSNPNNFVSCLGDLLVSAHNPFAGSWLEGSGAQTIERALTQWFAREIGLPNTAGGIFLSGGSISNLAAIAVAREVHFGCRDWRHGVAYFSDQTHSSIERALRILGFSKSQIRMLPSTENSVLSPRTFAEQVRIDRNLDLVPFCLVANAGTTNTGAVDPLPDLSDLCREEGIWLHVDGAYGGAAVLCPEGKTRLNGIDRADSVTIDPHKWLFQPYDCSILLVREAADLKKAFHTGAEYLQDARGDWNLWDYGPELTRPFRALKLWFSLQTFGAGTFRDGISRGFALARRAEARIRSLPNAQILSPANMAVVTFRFAPQNVPHGALDDLNAEIAKRCMTRGFAFIVSTQVAKNTALRVCTINPRTTELDIDETVQHLANLAEEILRERGY